MGLPEELLSEKEPSSLLYKVGKLAKELAQDRTGTEFDLGAWESALTPIDFDLVVLAHFMGTWENSGSFVNEAKNWQQHQRMVERALVTCGCERTAVSFDEAAQLGIEIENGYSNGRDITGEQEIRREELNRAADEDVSYRKLANFIRVHHGELLKE